jgi:retron-type reverse transcriptase
MCVECAEDNHPLFNFPRMYRAYFACRRNKRNKSSALAFELNHEENLVALVEELRERRYRPSTSICFYTQKPKAREIFAAAFRDRIVHHLIYEALAPVWERVFIHHSYACRPEKGTHAAALALQRFLRQATANGSRPASFLKMDIHNFFMTIDRRKLFDMLAARCHDPDLLWLLHIIVFHDPTSTTSCRICKISSRACRRTNRCFMPDLFAACRSAISPASFSPMFI